VVLGFQESEGGRKPEAYGELIAAACTADGEAADAAAAAGKACDMGRRIDGATEPGAPRKERERVGDGKGRVEVEYSMWKRRRLGGVSEDVRYFSI